MEGLKQKGAKFVEELDEVPDGAVTVFSAHGVPQSVVRDAKARSLPVIDATCPLVSKVHTQAKRYVGQGRTLILIGHPGHPEVEGTMGQAGAPVHLVSSIGDVDRLDIPRAAPVASTTFLCLDTVGSPELLLIEGEGFLLMYEYPSQQKERVAAAARDAGVPLRRGMRFTFATDGLVPLRRGYQVASLGSVTEHLMPANYHWPTDTADNVNYCTVADAAAVVLATIART